MKYAILITVAFIIAGCASTEYAPQVVEPVESDAQSLEEQEELLWQRMREAERRRLDAEVGRMLNEQRGLRGTNHSDAAPMPFGDGVCGRWYVPVLEGQHREGRRDVMRRAASSMPPAVPSND